VRLIGWLVGAIIVVQSNAAEYPRLLDIPDDAATRFALERISARSGISLPRASWPLLAREARQFLDLAVAKDSSILTPADSVVLSDLLVGPVELKRWEGIGSSLLAINARAGGQWTATDSGDGSNERMGWLGGRMYGVVGGDLWFYSDARIFTRWSDEYKYWDRYALADGEPSGVPFDDPSQGGRYKSNTGARYTAWAQWTRDWVTLKYGRDRLQFGPGVWTGLTTNYSTPPYQMLDTRISPFPWLTVQATVLEARRGEVLGGISFPGDDRKWMHVHRYEIRPLDGLTLAFQNQILYKDSAGINPAYLLPLVPIFFSQDLSGNRDNSAMQFDFTYASKVGTKVWSALLIDDLNSLTDFFGSFWLNRWAILAGGQVLSPWQSIDADLTAEFSFVRPWTFTGGREEAYTFAHYGMPMGTELGPDSRTFHARLAWRIWKGLEMGSSFALLQKGMGRQATLGTVNGHGAVDPLTSKLFSGGHSSSTKYGIDGAFDWNAIANIRLNLALAHRSATGGSESTWLEGGAAWVADW
jgi:hypothetical protein